MKLITLLAAFFFFSGNPLWFENMDEAKQEAVRSHKNIMISFSGSDWCIPCIRMEKEVFSSSSFSDFAGSNLVLVKADFPRLKKNRLSGEQTARNEALAARYNPHGKFPYTILLDEKGSVIKEWDGYPSSGPQKFIDDINSVLHSAH